MLKWLRKKLGVNDNTDELIDLNTKMYEIIRLVSNNSNAIEQLHKEIKSIPKEIVVKNVLSI